MSKTLLVTRPQHDETTNYLCFWAEPVIEEARKRNFKVLDLKGAKANAEDFSGRMKKIKPSLLFLNGHGNSDSITGHEDEELVSTNKNKGLLMDKIIYALSCSSAKNLGKFAVKNGTKSFVGYKEDFVFMSEENKSTRPIKDETAKLFFEPSNLVVTTLIKGNSTLEAYNRSQDKFKQNIRKLITSESPQEDRSPIPLLMWDMANQSCLGDNNTKV